MKKIFWLFAVPGLLLVSCGAEKETTETVEEKDTLADYAEEETGNDPAGMPCGMQGMGDTVNTTYRGGALSIMVRYNCPGEVNFPDDNTEKTLTNPNEKENYVTIALKGKKTDTSFFLMKKHFSDSLDTDFLTNSVLGTTAFKELSGKEDFIFTTFVGKAYSDDGLLVTFCFNRKKGIRVLSTESPEMGEETETEE